MTYEDLLQTAADRGLKIHENWDLGRVKGLYVDGNIALSSHLDTSIKKACILAEEIGHYETSYGNILDQSIEENRRQEHRARTWAYNFLVPVETIMAALAEGYREIWELAEYLEVEEWFLIGCLKHYGLID
jgi:Zn-dependent peptidase ImmA (M78 family)